MQIVAIIMCNPCLSRTLHKAKTAHHSIANEAKEPFVFLLCESEAEHYPNLSSPCCLTSSSDILGGLV